MQQIQSPSYIQSESKTEREIILQLAVAVRTMVHNSEGLAKYEIIIEIGNPRIDLLNCLFLDFIHQILSITK